MENSNDSAKPVSKYRKILIETGIVLLITISFVSGYVASNVVSSVKNNSITTTTVLDSTVSPALSDRNELILLNRQTGTYTIYAASMSEAIYHLYRAKLLYTKADYTSSKGN